MKENNFPSDKLDKFMLRFPEGMRDRVRVAAEQNGRSMNTEIIQRLEATFGGRGFNFPAAAGAAMTAAAAREMALDHKGLAVSAVISEQLNERILAACIAGKRAVKVLLSEAMSDPSLSNGEIETALILVKNAFDAQGYKVTITETEIVVEY